MLGGVDVSEIWLLNNNNKKVAVRKRIANDDIHALLNQTQNDSDWQNASLLLRLIFVRFRHKACTYEISQEVLDQILRHFQLEVPNRWNGTTYAGSTSFPVVHGPQGGVLRFSTCNHPKVSIAWSYSLSERVTQGIFFANFERMPQLLRLLESLIETADHPMFVALVYGITLSFDIERGHKLQKELIRKVEFRTGYHAWQVRTGPPAEGSYTMLSASMAGAATKLANFSRRSRVLGELCEFITEY